MSVVPTDAQSRIEKLLSDLLNENTSDISPQSRNEAFLLGLINKVVPDITPVSRVECYLKTLCEKNTSSYLTDKDLDTTLKEVGKAADAAAVGDALSTLSEEIENIPSGQDGVTPTIGDNGNWYLGDTDTGKPSRGEQGEKGDTGAQGAKGDKGEPGAKGDTGPAGVPGKDGAKGDPGTPGKDGHSPVVTATKSGKTTTISVDGAAIATVEDGAPGKDGADGKPGAAGADGAKGADGITPHIGDNGNWYLGDTDTGKPSRGAKGDNGDTTVVDAALDGTSKNPVQNKAIYAALDAKAERVNSAERTVRVEISGTLIYVYFFSGSGYWVRLCFQSRSASGQSYSITRLNGVRASKDKDFASYITIVPDGYLEYVFAARIGGSSGAWVGGFAHGHENATKTVISLDSVAIESDGTYYGRELRIEQTSEIYNPTGGAKIADHYVLNTITADDGWRVAQTIKWVSAVKLSADTYLCMFALTRNSIAKMARNYDYTLYTVPAYGESNATLGAKVDASACVMTGDIDCEVEQLETSGNDCHLFYSDNTYKGHYKVYFRFLTGETEIASGTVFSSKFRVAFNSQLSAVSSNVIHGDEYYTKDETEAKIAELLGVVENGTYSKSEIDTMMGSYISDVAALVGGDA